MRLDLAQPLQLLVSRKFTAARETGALIFSSTDLAIIHTTNGVPFQLRYCPALSKKPTANKLPKEEAKPAHKFDPFEKPSEELLVAEVPRLNPSYFLVLNKYPVIPNHFILATKAMKPQTDILEQDDIAATYSCLTTWSKEASHSGGSGLFAFFNSGDKSGASQPHRHIQFLPVDDVAGKQGSGSWRILLDRMTTPLNQQPSLIHDPSLPFQHFASRIAGDPSPQDLHRKYLHLYETALRASRGDSSLSELEQISKEKWNGPAEIDYNLAMNTEMMIICPRRSEGAEMTWEGGSGDVSLNGTILGGTLMVKEIEEWDHLKRNPSALDYILKAVAFPIKNGSGETRL